MKEHNLLVITSLLSLLLLTCHVADDIVRGLSPGGLGNIAAIVGMTVWLYGTLVLAGRRSGYVIVFLLTLVGSGVPVIHMTHAGMVGGRIAHTNGMFFWVFTLLASGALSLFSVVLAARGWWGLRVRV
jgi:hypothetical protein